MKCFAPGNLVEHFEDGAFWRGQCEWILPMSPRLLRKAALLGGCGAASPFVKYAGTSGF